jgi:hypothetical protein
MHVWKYRRIQLIYTNKNKEIRDVIKDLEKSRQEIMGYPLVLAGTPYIQDSRGAYI